MPSQGQAQPELQLASVGLAGRDMTGLCPLGKWLPSWEVARTFPGCSLCSCPLPAPLPVSLPSWVSRLLAPFHTVSCSASQRPSCQVELPWLLKMPVKCIYCGRATLLGSPRRISTIIIVFKNQTNYFLPYNAFIHSVSILKCLLRGRIFLIK